MTSILPKFLRGAPTFPEGGFVGEGLKLVTDALVEAGLTYEGVREYWTPRRLTLDIRGLNARSADVREEKKGPRTDANEKAIEGFLRGAGLNGTRMLLQVHDELVFEVPEAEIDAASAVIREVMAGAAEPAVQLSVPLGIEIGTGANWGSAH